MVNMVYCNHLFTHWQTRYKPMVDDNQEGAQEGHEVKYGKWET